MPFSLPPGKAVDKNTYIIISRGHEIFGKLVTVFAGAARTIGNDRCFWGIACQKGSYFFFKLPQRQRNRPFDMSLLVVIPGTGIIKGIAVDPQDWHRAWVVKGNQVAFTDDAGATWTEVTFNLPAETSEIRDAAFVDISPLAGDGVPRDYALGRQWLERAAASGLGRSQYTLGKLYEYGLGVEKDPASALGYFRQAADGGFAKAQYNLAKAYRDGFGVAKDDALSVQWFARAAKQGHARAQTRLGTRYASGVGVKADRIERLEDRPRRWLARRRSWPVRTRRYRPGFL